MSPDEAWLSGDRPWKMMMMPRAFFDFFPIVLLFVFSITTTACDLFSIGKDFTDFVPSPSTTIHSISGGITRVT